MTGIVPSVAATEGVDAPVRPIVSVVVPARDEELILPRTVPLLLEASARIGGRVEVLVVVPEWSTVWRRPPVSTPTLNWVRARYDGKYAALRDGVVVARSDVLVFFDADVLVDPSAVEALAAPLLTGVADVVAGRIEIIRGAEGRVARVLESWSQTSARSWHRMRLEQPELLWALPGAVWALRRDLFPAALLEPSVDDVSLGLSLREVGARFAYAPEAVVHTWAPATLVEWCRQKLRARTGWALLAARRPDQMRHLESTFRRYLDATRQRGPATGAMELSDRVLRLVAQLHARLAPRPSGVWTTARSRGRRALGAGRW